MRRRVAHRLPRLLQTQYFWDFSGRTQNYFGRFQADRTDVVTYLNATADGHIVLEDVHREVLAYHNLSAASGVPAPQDGVLVTYNLATPHAQAAWHYWTCLLYTSPSPRDS